MSKFYFTHTWLALWSYFLERGGTPLKFPIMVGCGCMRFIPFLGFIIKGVFTIVTVQELLKVRKVSIGASIDDVRDTGDYMLTLTANGASLEVVIKMFI